jgi:hypothetical protein
MPDKLKSAMVWLAMAAAALIVGAWVVTNGIDAAVWLHGKLNQKQPALVAPPAQPGPHAEMELTPPDKPTLVWPMVQCIRDPRRCAVPLNRIATMRNAGKKVRLCVMVDTKAECIGLPAEWRGVEAGP